MRLDNLRLSLIRPILSNTHHLGYSVSNTNHKMMSYMDQLYYISSLISIIDLYNCQSWLSKFAKARLNIVTNIYS